MTQVKKLYRSFLVTDSIVLFHNAAENTLEALPAIIEGLIADGYHIIPVSGILMKDEYKIEHTGLQYKK